MIIEINKDYRITTDSLNFILQRQHKSRWINEAYHNSLSGIISTLLERDFKAVGTESLVMALKRNQMLVCSLQQALTPLYDVDIRPLSDNTLKDEMTPGGKS